MLNTSDLNAPNLSGNVTIKNKSARFTKSIVADGTFEGTEKFVAKLRKGSVTGNVVASTGVVTILDTSTASPLPTYSLAANKTSVDEGSNVNIVLTTTNITAGTTIPYTITGIDSNDISGAPLTGRFTVSGAGTASLTLNIAADNLTEGIETLTLSLDNINPTVSVSIVINDTSESPPLAPTYLLSVNASTVNEGGSVTFTLSTTNVLRGTQVPYTITGVSTADIGAPLTGNFTVGSTGTATLALSIVNDSLTEGTETLTVTLDGITPTVSQSVSIIDTSLSPNAPTYRLTASSPNVNEGSTVTITLTTTNVANGTLVPYAITGTGITAADFGGAFLTGNFNISNNTATITLPVTADATDEGPEAFTVTLTGITPTVSTVVTINDTSKTSLAPSYALGASSPKINEGQSVTITLTTNNVAAGTLVPYTISGNGITSDDIGGAPLYGNFAVTASGTASATITLTTTADQLTEGIENLTVSLNSVSPPTSVTVTIEDTSKAPTASYALSCSTAQISTQYASTAQQITINGYHRQYLGRNATPGEITYWDTNVSSGTFTLSQVSTSIKNSAEAGGWDGSVTATENNDRVDIALTTSNVPVGTQVPYTITGVSPGDFAVGTSLTGYFTVGAGGTATISLVTNPDRITEGVEVATVTLGGVSPTVSTSFKIFDSSKAPTYTLTSSVNTVNEGSSVTITLTTTEVDNGTVIPFTLSGTGINSSDLTSAGLTWNAGANRFDGSFTVNNNTASIVANIVADGTTEGAETFNVTLSAITPTVTKSITITDTSVTQTGTGSWTVPGTQGTVATLPADAAWVAFKMIGAGGSGAGTDGGGSSGLGYSTVTDRYWTSNLNSSGIKTSTNPFTFQVGFWVPNSGAHSFVFTTDNLGTFSIDGVQYGNWSDYRTDQTGVIPNLTAGGHTLVVTCTDTGGQQGVGLRIFAADGRRIFSTWQVASSGGGSGGPGSYIEGVVRLPATSGPKVIRAGAGAPGKGGAKYTNSGGAPELGGLGFGLATVSGSNIVFSSGSGGRGGRSGPSGGSGQGGAGGGSTSLYYVVGFGTTTPVVTNIAVAGGGGGGGGKSNHQNWASNAQLISGLNLISPVPDNQGQDCPSDGGGGGGGGGGAPGGNGGRHGVDQGQTSSGGDVGTNYKNNSLTWNTYNENIQRIDGSIFLPGTTFSNPKVGYLGIGGTGVLTAGTWTGDAVGTGGVGGGVALYWTTSLTAPDLSTVPGFGDAAAQVTVSLPATQDSPGSITFCGDGTCVINATNGTWINGASLPGIGEWYAIKFVSSAPSNGTAKGTYSSNVTENVWFVPTGNGPTGYYVTSTDGYMNVTVSIMSRVSGATVGTAVYRNVGTGAYIDWSYI